MTSLTGASGEDFASILRSLGYRMDRRPKPAEPALLRPPETDLLPEAIAPVTPDKSRPNRPLLPKRRQPPSAPNQTWHPAGRCRAGAAAPMRRRAFHRRLAKGIAGPSGRRPQLKHKRPSSAAPAQTGQTDGRRAGGAVGAPAKPPVAPRRSRATPPPAGETRESGDRPPRRERHKHRDAPRSKQTPGRRSAAKAGCGGRQHPDRGGRPP